MQLVQSGMTHISGERIFTSLVLEDHLLVVGIKHVGTLMMFASLDYRNFVGERIRGCLVVGTFFF